MRLRCSIKSRDALSPVWVEVGFERDASKHHPTTDRHPCKRQEPDAGSGDDMEIDNYLRPVMLMEVFSWINLVWLMEDVVAVDKQ